MRTTQSLPYAASSTYAPYGASERRRNMERSDNLDKSCETQRSLLNTEQAATYVGSTRSTLEKKRMRGDGPIFLKIGRRVVYDKRDLDAWLDSCRRRSTSEEA